MMTEGFLSFCEKCDGVLNPVLGIGADGAVYNTDFPITASLCSDCYIRQEIANGTL